MGRLFQEVSSRASPGPKAAPLLQLHRLSVSAKDQMKSIAMKVWG